MVSLKCPEDIFTISTGMLVWKVMPSPASARAAAPSRAGKKHFGGYLGDDTLEKIALLRVRLKKDNSELIEFAIEELFRKHNAKRAFGDA